MKPILTYIIFVVGILICGCSAPAIQSVKWQPAYTESFTDADLNAWLRIDGKWQMKEGRISGEGRDQACLLLEKPVTGDVRIEMTAAVIPDEKYTSHQIGLLINASWRKLDRNGYFAVSDSNMGLALQAYAKEVIADKNHTGPKPGKYHHILFERIGKHVRLVWDHKNELSWNDPEYVPRTSADSLIGIYTHNCHIQIKAFSAFQRGQAAIEQAGNPLTAAGRFTYVNQLNPAEEKHFQLIRKRLLAFSAGRLNAIHWDQAEEWLTSMRDDGSWPDIDYWDLARTKWKPAIHARRLKILAGAYMLERSPLHNNPRVLRAALKGLDFWIRNNFICRNWWYNDISVTRNMGPFALWLEPYLNNVQKSALVRILERAYMDKWTGQNLVWTGTATLYRALLQRDRELLAKVFRLISAEVTLEKFEGIKPDGSFYQHGAQLYNHGYGAGFAVDIPRIAGWAAGTPYALSQDKVDIITAYVLDGSQWMAFNQEIDSSADSREYTRSSAAKPGSARYLATAADLLLQLPTGREAELNALIQRSGGQEGAQPLIGSHHFYYGDYTTHHRENWYASVKMHSTRTLSGELVNQEGLKSHYLSDGLMYIMRTGNEYMGIYPVWDYLKLPGTTLVQDKVLFEQEVKHKGETDFVGAASNGMITFTAMDMKRPEYKAAKSWFFLDDEIICLGAGITSDSDKPIVTTLNQCLLRGDVTAKGKTLEVPYKDTIADSSIQHDGINYYIPDDQNTQLSAGPQTGSWMELSTTESSKPVTKDVFALWIDHGVRPENASYVYAIVPGCKDPAAYSKDWPITIVSNTPELQAVYHKEKQLLGAAFYEAGSLAIPDGRELKVDQPCILLLDKSGDKPALTISDPARKAETVKVTFGETITIDLPTGTKAGSSITLSF